MPACRLAPDRSALRVEIVGGRAGAQPADARLHVLDRSGKRRLAREAVGNAGNDIAARRKRGEDPGPVDIGSAAARTGQRATQGAKSELSGGLKGGANAATRAASGARTGMQGTGKAGAAGARIGAGVDADAGAGLKGVIPAR